jgi:hypothetical protein
MKKTLIATSVALLMGAGAADAAFLQAGSTGTINFNAGCFTFGDCAIGGLGNITDNAITVSGSGSGIAGDGLVGVLGFTVGADGNTLAITSFSQDTFTGTAGGNFAIFANDITGMSGSISDAGDVSLDLTGRLGLAQFFVASLGIQPWNIDNAASIAAQGDSTTGLYESITSGASANWTPGTPGTPSVSLTGSALTGPAGAWTGGLVSAGNVGAGWSLFDGTPYTEKYNITVNGTAAPAVPVPAALWLFGSGLLGLVGVARRKMS